MSLQSNHQAETNARTRLAKKPLLIADDKMPFTGWTVYD
jgi:hypothetical protein